MTAQSPDRPEDAQPVAWRWRPIGTSSWIYNPEPAWLEEHKSEIEYSPLYASPVVPAPDREAIAEVRATLERIEKFDCFYTGREYVTETSIVVEDDGVHNVLVRGHCGRIARQAINKIDAILALPSVQATPAPDTNSAPDFKASQNNAERLPNGDTAGSGAGYAPDAGQAGRDDNRPTVVLPIDELINRLALMRATLVEMSVVITSRDPFTRFDEADLEPVEELLLHVDYLQREWPRAARMEQAR